MNQGGEIIDLFDKGFEIIDQIGMTFWYSRPEKAVWPKPTK